MAHGLIEKTKDKVNYENLVETSQIYRSKYYALVEIGGAYAYKFIPFAEFLGIPCLILTDLDSVSGQKGENGRIYYKSVRGSCGETTSNETLKWWKITRGEEAEHIRDGLFEYRTKFGSDTTRTFYYFFVGQKVVVTGGFIKRAGKRPAVR